MSNTTKKNGENNSRIRETLNILTDANNSTDAKMERNGQKGPFPTAARRVRSAHPEKLPKTHLNNR